MAEYGEFIEETTSSTGTGAITLAGGGQPGSRTFAEEIPDGEYAEYTIVASDGQWEIGFSLFAAAGPTLDRSFVMRSTNGDAAINLPAGTHTVTQSPSAVRLMSHRFFANSLAGDPSIAPFVYENLDLQAPLVDTSGMWSLVNPERIVPPPWAKSIKFAAAFQAAFGGSTGGQGVRVTKNAVGIGGEPVADGFYGGQNGGIVSTHSGELSFAPGDYFSLSVRQDNNTTKSIISAGTWIEATLIP